MSSRCSRSRFDEGEAYCVSSQRPSHYPKTRAESSHHPTRQRERRMQGVTSAGQAQRFLSADGLIAQHVRPRRHRLSAPTYRHAMAQRFQSWHEVTGTAAA
jgi:putative transposase